MQRSKAGEENLLVVSGDVALDEERRSLTVSDRFRKVGAARHRWADSRTGYQFENSISSFGIAKEMGCHAYTLTMQACKGCLASNEQSQLGRVQV